MKTCTKCQVEKPITEFHKQRNGTRSQCKACRNTYLKEWGAKNPNKRREQKYRDRYGISSEQYDSLLEKQNDRCAICQQRSFTFSERFLLVDHDHNTGIVRGLLCRNCNTAIGLLRDDYQIVGQAAYYLTNDR